MSFFFYDLETSSLDPRLGRIMQFAGQRTDEDFQPIGEPVNLLVKLSDDILPDPHAILVTGITPQVTLSDGITEPEFTKFISEEIFTPNTVLVGYNNIRFDDEFIRNTLWRNFYDPYEWSWKDGRSRWDMLDVVRMTRALRPDGINWPVNDNGKPANKLELLASQNGLTHEKAHDALSDVEALISLTKLIKQKQPKLFDYMLKMRQKNEVSQLVDVLSPKPFVYVSGRYPSENNHSTVVLPIAQGPNLNSVIVFDLRFNPDDFLNLSEAEISKKIFASWEEKKQDDFVALPVKELMLNKCPAVAPIGVLGDKDLKRLNLSLKEIGKNIKKITNNRNFSAKIQNAYKNKPSFELGDIESSLYDSFTPEDDKGRCLKVRLSGKNELSKLDLKFSDRRLDELFFRYKARWFNEALSESQVKKWQKYRVEKLQASSVKYFEDLRDISQHANSEFIVEELRLWADSLV